MARIQKNSRLLGILLVVVVIGGAFKVTENVNDRLKAMPVFSVEKKEIKIAELDTKNLYPVVVRQKKAALARDGQQVEIDSVFREKVVVVEPPPPPPPPDFGAMFRQNLALDATTPTGAFINGRYFQVGQTMDQYALTNGSESIVPRLVGVRGGSVVIGFGVNGQVTLKVPDEL